MSTTTYDTPIHGTYNFPNYDFAETVGSSTTHSIPVPAGYKGKLKDISVALTEITAWTANLGIVQVGITGNTDAYGQLNIPTGQADNSIYNSTDDTDAIIAADIAAETCVIVTLTEATGGVLTGQGYVTVYIDWYK